MDDSTKKYEFSTFFTKGQYETQVETLEIADKDSQISIGVPKELAPNEHRISLVPNSISSLIGYGHKVIVETGAGLDSNFSDNDFSEAGAEIALHKKRVYESDIIVKAAPPISEELQYFHPNQILISPLTIPVITNEILVELKKRRVIALAMEYLQSDKGSFPVVRIMSEIAGMSAILTAAELLTNSQGGRGMILGGISGVPPSKVVILGAGVVAEYATRIALGLGASVRIFDNDIYKLMRLQKSIGRQLHTSTFNPRYLSYQLKSADAVIGAIHSKTGRSPLVLTEEMISNMKEGSVFIDVSIDQGGCSETSRMTTHAEPTFVKHGVIHYCVPNIASKVSRTASIAVSNILTPLILRIGSSSNIERLLFVNRGIQNGVYTYKGFLTNEYLAKRFGMHYTALELLLTSDR